MVADPIAEGAYFDRAAANDVIIPDSGAVSKPERLYGWTDPNAAGETLYAWTDPNTGDTFYTKVTDPTQLSMNPDTSINSMYTDSRDESELYDASGNTLQLDSFTTAHTYRFIECVTENSITLHYGGHSG